MSPERKRPDRRQPKGKLAEGRHERVVAAVSAASLAVIVTTFALTGATEAAAFAAGLGTGAAGIYLAMKNRPVAAKKRDR